MSATAFSGPLRNLPPSVQRSRNRRRIALAGGMVVVVDDEDRENEGDLVMAAEHVTPEAVNFMASAMAASLICLDAVRSALPAAQPCR